ncbi:MAG: pantetheine-phosphate adenylyltransferase [Deltaproteobacteria bacterium]|nr:pantetheine-phosphate adenylyltransferase [Deltaproteobacteria bacterium]
MRIAIYAGTFDPVTFGHLSVIKRAAGLFDAVVVLVAVNPCKQPMFDVHDRLLMIRESVSAWTNVGCASTEGLVVDFARAHHARFLVRGVRTCTDAEAEIALAHANHELAPEIETVFVPAEPGLSEASSSRLKELASQGADLTPWCPPQVAKRLQQRFGRAAFEEAAHAPL